MAKWNNCAVFRRILNHKRNRLGVKIYAYADREGYGTQHYIRVPIVEEAILFNIKTVAKYVHKNEADFIERVRESSTIRQKESGH